MPRDSSPGSARRLSEQLELGEQRRDPRVDVGDAVQPRDEPQMLLDREILEQVRLVGNERERALRFDRHRAAMSWPAIAIAAAATAR